ncbi:MAG: exodeoxyribonuclease VII small subunit [Alphaproteobacteria bacterium]|nr:exodeoxyribonuclease VII small subunit [Alphaproteobacteria bacterium]
MADTHTTLPDDIAGMTFEQALAELETVVRRLEGGDVGLEDSIEMYTRGAQLKQHCAAKLADAQARIEKVVVGADGISAQPADIG